MQKLTREQRDYILDKIGTIEAPFLLKVDPAGVYLNVVSLHEILDGCTKEEFPNFKINISRTADPYLLEINNGFKQRISLQDPHGITSFTFSEFKQFTEGCNRVVEWMETQNAETDD